MNVNLFREYKRIFVLGLLFESGNVFAQDEPSWNDPPVTGRSQPVYIVDATIDGIQIDITNDWIGIFDDTLIVGKDQVDGLPAINPITANLEYTPPINDPLPGGRTGFPMLFKIWDASTNQDLDADIIEIVSGDTVFSEGTIVAVRINARAQVERYTLTISVIPLEGGMTDPIVGDHDYDEGVEVTLTATATPGWQFVSWTGDVADTNSSWIKVTMDRDKEVRADFELIPTDIPTNLNESPKGYRLEQNYPNPFNPMTVINYNLPIPNEVEISIYNLVGQKVANLVSEKQLAGFYKVKWDASGFPSGAYLYKFTAGDITQIRKMILVK